MERGFERDLPMSEDPLARILSEPIYLKVTEGRHPHVPLQATIAKALTQATPGERQTVAHNAKIFLESAQLVMAALGEPITSTF
jgi:hypothetical protein